MQNFKHGRSKDAVAGFTLIEMLVVTTIMIVLTAISFVNFRVASQKSRNSRREADISQVRAALELYRSANFAYPVYSGSGTTSNFTSLIANNNFNTYLVTKSMTDPLNTSPYQYTYQSSASGATYTVCYNTEPNATQVCQTNP